MAIKFKGSPGGREQPVNLLSLTSDQVVSETRTWDGELSVELSNEHMSKEVKVPYAL